MGGKRRLAEQHGLSLMEIMVAMAVVAFALVTMIGVYISSVRLLSRGEEMTVAAELGRRAIERVKILGYDAIPEAKTTYDGRAPDPVSPDGFPPPPYPAKDNYKIVFTAEKIDTDLKSVTARIYYDGKSHIVLQTYLRPR